MSIIQQLNENVAVVLITTNGDLELFLFVIDKFGCGIEPKGINRRRRTHCKSHSIREFLT